jgi:hypothetical protein
VIGFVQASDDSPWYNFSYEGGTAWVHADLTSAEPPNLQFAEPSGCAAPTPAQAAPIQPTQEQASSARVPPNTNHIESAITQAGYDVKSIIISPNLIQIEIDATRLALSDSTASGILDIETRDDMNIISTVLRTMRDSNYAIPSQIRVVYQVRSLPDLPVLCDFSNPESFVNGSITAEDYYWANCLIEYE